MHIPSPNPFSDADFEPSRTDNLVDLHLPDLPAQACGTSAAWQDLALQRTLSSTSSQTAMSAQSRTHTGLQDIDMLETQSLDDESLHSSKAMIVQPSVTPEFASLPYMSCETLSPLQESAVDAPGLQSRSTVSENNSLAINNVSPLSTGAPPSQDVSLDHMRLGPCSMQSEARVPVAAGFTCPFSGKQLSSGSVFKTHILEFHEAQCIVCCNHCSKDFTLLKRFKDHHKDYHGECSASTDGGNNEECSHKVDRLIKTYFGCGFCASGFGGLRSYVKHLAQVHGKADSETVFYSKDRVVLGLLTRPGVAEAWRRLSSPSTIYSWPEAGVDQLIEDLELGHRKEAVLAGGTNTECEMLACKALRSAIVTGNELSATESSEGPPVTCVLRPATSRLRSRLSFGGRRVQKSKQRTAEEVAAAKAEDRAETLRNLRQIGLMS